MIHNEQVHKELTTKYEDAKDKPLHDLCDLLKFENVHENENLERTLHETACRIALLEARVQTLLSRDAPITIREAMRILERWICYEASGSKTRFMKKYYNFDKINTTGDSAVRSDLAIVLAKLKLTSEHTDTLGYLKDCGDLSAHNRPGAGMTVEQWDSSIVDNDEDKSNYDDEIAVATLKKELLEALAYFVPPPDDGSVWVMEDPVEKSRKR